MKVSKFAWTLLLASTAQAATKTFDWTVSWVTADPAGQHPRQAIGINGEWPLPRVEVDKGDRVIVNVHNGLGDRNTSFHFHGMFQNGTNSMDGPANMNQCPIPPGANFTYDFEVHQNGTYWYHSHTMGQYPDGQRAPFIVHDKDAYFAKMYDEELTFTVSDWYNEVMDVLDHKFLSIYNPTGAEPVPEYLIFNEGFNQSVQVKPNTTYLAHIMNIGALGSVYFWLEDHNMTIVEVDGVYVEPQEVDVIYITAAQRYGVLFTTKEQTDKNYAIVSVFDSGLFDRPQDCLTPNTTNWLEYNKDAPHDWYTVPYDSSDDIQAFDDFNLIPADRMPLLPEPDHELELTVTMNNLLNGVNYAFFNNITYTAPKVPTLYTVMSAPEDLIENPQIYGEFVHPFVLKHMETVQIVINSNDPGTHPFHLHGHTFQLIARSESSETDQIIFDPKNHTEFPAIPMRRDTTEVKPNGHIVLRFTADNPGVWFFHCHIEWHMSQGLGLTFIEAPDLIRKQSIPQNHYDVCALSQHPHSGNAAGNTVNFLDLSGQNEQVPELPPGFTARGIVALVFSCVCAFVGMAIIAWYGMSDLSKSDQQIATLIEEHEYLENEEVDKNVR